MSEIGERVKKIVVEHLGVEPEKVVDAASFIDDLGADSLDTVELVMAFEEEFGCEIPTTPRRRSSPSATPPSFSRRTRRAKALHFRGDNIETGRTASRRSAGFLLSAANLSK